MIIKYDILINEGEYAGGVVQLDTTLDELENSTLADMLIAKGYLKCWCNADEFTILYRFAQIKHDDDQENNTPAADCALCASVQMEERVGQATAIVRIREHFRKLHQELQARETALIKNFSAKWK